MTAPVALLLVGLAHWAPEMLSALMGGTVAAWDYVMQGAVAAGLWLAVGAGATHWSVRAVCVYGAIEAAQRPLCRMAFPMDRPPMLGGQTMCEAAYGVSLGWLGVLAALFTVALTQEAQRA